MKRKPKKIDEKITYHRFFQEVLNLGLVKPWQENEIQAFFKDLGLSNKETPDSYKDALSKY